MSTTRPNQFLDLPRELRFMIYEWFLIRTKHHIIENGPNCRAVIIMKHIDNGKAILACRKIYFEATALRRRIARLNEEPLRISVQGPLSAPLLEAIFLYAGNYSAHHHESLDTSSATKRLLQSSLHLQDLLRCRAPGYTRHVELSIDCSGEKIIRDAKSASRKLAFFMSTLDTALPKRLVVTMRPYLLPEYAAVYLEYHRIMVVCHDDSVWKTVRGKWLGEVEWDETWEGEKTL